MYTSLRVSYIVVGIQVSLFNWTKMSLIASIIYCKISQDLIRKSFLKRFGTLQNPLAVLQFLFKLWIFNVWPSELNLSVFVIFVRQSETIRYFQYLNIHSNSFCLIVRVIKLLTGSVLFFYLNKESVIVFTFCNQVLFLCSISVVVSYLEVIWSCIKKIVPQIYLSYSPLSFIIYSLNFKLNLWLCMCIKSLTNHKLFSGLVWSLSWTSRDSKESWQHVFIQIVVA